MGQITNEQSDLIKGDSSFTSHPTSSVLQLKDMEKFKGVDISCKKWEEMEDLDGLLTSTKLWEEVVDLKDVIFFCGSCL